jgi:phosphoribosylformylglycinamidine synthase
MEYRGVSDVRQGKYFELEVDAKSADEARATVSEVADKLLANPVIESYRIEIVP